MAQKIIDLTGKAQVLVPDQEELSEKLVEELIGLVQRAEALEKPNMGTSSPTGPIRSLFPESVTILTGLKSRVSRHDLRIRRSPLHHLIQTPTGKMVMTT